MDGVDGGSQDVLVCVAAGMPVPVTLGSRCAGARPIPRKADSRVICLGFSLSSLVLHNAAASLC